MGLHINYSFIQQILTDLYVVAGLEKDRSFQTLIDMPFIH